MKKKDDLFKEVFSEGYFSRAQIRARRRKSPWNLILIPLVLGGMGGTWYVLFQLMWRIHTIFHPDHMGRFNEFWREGINVPSLVSSMLLLIPLIFASIPLGMILANCVAWSIPPARHAFDKEAQGHKYCSFKESMTGLFLISIIMVPISLVISFIGAITLKDL